MEGGITEKLWALYVPLHEYEWRASDGVEPYKTVSGRWGKGILKFREFVRTWEGNLHQFYTK